MRNPCIESPTRPDKVNAEPKIMITLGIVLVVFDCFEDGSFDNCVETKAAGFIIMAIPTKSNTAKMIKKTIELFMFIFKCFL